MTDKGEEYLWDGGGAPDRDVERLEGLLGRYRYKAQAASRSTRPLGRWIGLAAAAVLLAVGGTLWLRPSDSPPGPQERPQLVIQVEKMMGEVDVNDSPWAPNRLMGVGDVVETGPDGRARLTLPDVGRVEVKEETLVEIVEIGRERSMLRLDRGTIRARITSEPRVFQVGTEAALAVDLGCIYELTVTERDETILAVDFGRVSLEMDGRTVYVPTGWVCRALPERGPGIPMWGQTSEALQTAVRHLEEGTGDPSKALQACLAAADEFDTLTLWHLFDVADDREGRGRVFDRLAGLAKRPAGVTREKCMRLDRGALDRWRKEIASMW